MGFKKTLLLTACVVMILGTAISGTLAYYQMSLVESAADAAADVDKNVNVIRVFHDGDGNRVDQMLPGMSVWQDVEIWNKATDGRYVFYTFEIPAELVEENVVTITNQLGENWIFKERLLKGNVYEYAYLYSNLVQAGQSVVACNAQKFDIDDGVGYDHKSGKYFIEPTVKNERTGDKVWLDVGLTFEMKVTAYSVSPIPETSDNNISLKNVEGAYKFVQDNKGSTSTSVAE